MASYGGYGGGSSISPANPLGAFGGGGGGVPSQNFTYAGQNPNGPANTMGQTGQLVHGGMNDPTLGQGYSQLQSLLSLFGPSMGLAESLGTQQVHNLEQQGLLGQADVQTQIANQQQQGLFQAGQLGLQGETLGVQQGALQRQMALLPQQYGLQQQGFGLQETEAKQNAQQQADAFMGQMTAGGQGVGAAATKGRSNIFQQLGNNLQNIGLQRQGAALTFQEQQAQQQDSQKELGIQSRSLGISEQEVSSRINNALAQLGIQGRLSAAQVLQSIGQVKQGVVSSIGPMLSTILQAANMPGALSPGGA